MKKTFLSIALVLGLISATTIANAQNGRFSVGAEIALPMGDFADATSLGFGGSVRYEYPIGDNLGLCGTAGYLMFSGRSGNGVDLGDWTMIPVQAGLKYYFTDNQDGCHTFVLLESINHAKNKYFAYE